MEVGGRVVVVTGGASGIGRALALRFAAEGAAAVAVADVDGAGAEAAARQVEQAGARALGVTTDVTREPEVVALVDRVEADLGPVDLFCSNAGIALGGGVDAPNADWDRIWAVNVMAHVYAARALIPRMAARGGGYLLNTASAAGLLTNLGAAPYSVTKHAAVGLAEWMAITYADQGIKVSCLCPQGVRTPMLMGGLEDRDPAGSAVLAAGGLVEPEEVADAVIAGLAEERFLILTHAEVAEYVKRKAGDPDRWLAGMRRQWARLREARGGA
ncbi:MAG TPA: SDR family oxidoreductase [Acidimicrobiales bacterium]|nr:SDR family oxidoreductase [Acidimicrobiales bacterium]